MQICLECGKVFEDDEIVHWQECVGEFWGFPAYKTFSGCPSCEGAYEDAEECENCGKYFALSALDENHLCEYCRKESEDEE